MMGLPLGFAQPLVLLGLLSIPVLWWLLRLIPPQPRRIDFPPTRLLFQIKPKEETPQKTPWWLTLLRLTLATLVILVAAGPLWNPPVETVTSRAPLALLIDDGFVAAGSWDARMRMADDLMARAETDNRAVALILQRRGVVVVGRKALQLRVEFRNLRHGIVGLGDGGRDVLFRVRAQRLNALRRRVQLKRKRLRRRQGKGPRGLRA